MGRRDVVGSSKGVVCTVESAVATANSHAADASLGPQAPRRQPRQSRSIAMVDAILEASTRVFEQRGYQQTTTNEVAEVAGVSVGSLYQYFPDKAALLTALHERHVEIVATTMLEALQVPLGPSRRVGPTLAAVVDNCLRVHHEQPRLQRLLHELMPQLAYPRAMSNASLRLGREVALWLQAANTHLSNEQAALASGTLLTMGESLVHATVLSPASPSVRAAQERDITLALHSYLHAQGVAEAPGPDRR